MGVVLSYFRKKKSTTEILEKLDQDIKKLEQFRRKNQERQKKFIAKLILYSIVLYIISALVFYFYYFPEKWKERLLYSIPLLLFPVMVWLVKKVLHWYFVKRIAENDLELGDLREKKKQILEDVMEKETYKKAKEILEKFDPVRYKELEGPKSPVKPTPGTELRQRQVMQRSPPGSQIRPTSTPRMMATPMRPQGGGGMRPGMTPYGPRGSAQGMHPRNILDSSIINGTPQGPPLPRPILPRERGAMDRMLEYLVGDGPQNRYALICRVCHSHNGMALKEEFEYIAFRCCYCYSVNPPRKKRPFAPRIEPPTPAPKPQTDSQDEEENSGSDEEGEDSGESETKEGVDSRGEVKQEEEEEVEEIQEGDIQREEGTGDALVGEENEEEEEMEIDTDRDQDGDNTGPCDKTDLLVQRKGSIKDE